MIATQTPSWATPGSHLIFPGILEMPPCAHQQHTRATDGRAVGFTDVPEKARCAVPYDLPPSTGGMPMVCMIDEPIGELRADQSRILGVFRKVHNP